MDETGSSSKCYLEIKMKWTTSIRESSECLLLGYSEVRLHAHAGGYCYGWVPSSGLGIDDKRFQRHTPGQEFIYRLSLGTEHNSFSQELTPIEVLLFFKNLICPKGKSLVLGGHPKK